MKKKIVIIVLAILLFGCSQNNIKVGKIYQNQSLTTSDLSEIFDYSSENIYVFSGEIQDNLYNCIEVIISNYENNELVDSKKRRFDLKLTSNKFNIFLDVNLHKSIVNICINSDKMYTYEEILKPLKINNEFLFKPNNQNNIIYSFENSYYSNEILLGSLKEKNGNRKYDISFRLVYKT